MKSRRLLLGRKTMTSLDSILKYKDITLPTKVHDSQGMVFPVVMYGCQSWTRKKAEHWRTDAFALRCWRRLESLSIARRSKRPTLKEINPEYSLEGLMLKLKLPYFGYLMKSWHTGKDPDAGKDWGQEKGVAEDEMVGWHHRFDGQNLRQTLGDSEGQGILACCSPWGHKESIITWWLNNQKIIILIGNRELT